MDCLVGYIGLSPEKGSVASKLYVTKLPGISLFNLTKIADKTDQNTAGEPDPQIVFDECEQRAILTFRNAFIAEMSECWHLNDLDVAECLICENKKRLATSLWYFEGHELMVERLASDRLNRFTTIDRKKAQELRDMLFERAMFELKTLVKGIDPNASPCTVKEEVKHNCLITKAYPIL